MEKPKKAKVLLTLYALVFLSLRLERQHFIIIMHACKFMAREAREGGTSVETVSDGKKLALFALHRQELIAHWVLVVLVLDKTKKDNMGHGSLIH